MSAPYLLWFGNEGLMKIFSLIMTESMNYLQRCLLNSPGWNGSVKYILKKKKSLFKHQCLSFIICVPPAPCQKHCENCKTLPREHLIGCHGVKMFLIKDPFKFSFLLKLRFVIFPVLSQLGLISFVTIWFFEFCHNLSFVQFRLFEIFCSQLEFCHNLSVVTTWLLSQFVFCHNLGCHNFSFVTTWVLLQFKLCQNLSFWVWSQFDFFFGHNLSLSFVRIEFFDFFTILAWGSSQIEFWIVSQFEFLSFIKTWVFCFLTIWVFEFHHNLSFKVSSQLEFLSLTTIWVFEVHHNWNWSFWVLSPFELFDLVINWVFFWHFELLSFITIWVFLVLSQFEFLSFWVWPPFEFLSFITIGVF